MEPKTYLEHQVNMSGIIINVFKKCEQEMIANKLNYQLVNPKERVADYLGISRASVHAAVVPLKDTAEFEFTISNRQMVYQLLADLYQFKADANNVFQPENIYHSLIKAIQKADKKASRVHGTYIFNMTFESLGKMIHQMRLEYRKIPNGEYILVSNPDDASERYFYLDKIIKARKAQKRIYYVDERLLRSTGEIVRPWTVQSLTENTEEIKDGLVFYHVISQSGYVNGLFCNLFSKENFEKWLTDVVLPLLEPASVIVISKTANNHYITTEPVSKYDSKQTMMQWLRENNIPHSPKMHKSELYKLSQRFSNRTSYHSLEKLLKPYGHEILLIPHTLYDLSVPELAWNAIKPLMAEKATYGLGSGSTLNEGKRMIAHLISSITEDTWTNYNTIVEETEFELYHIELETDALLEQYQLIDSKDNLE